MSLRNALDFAFFNLDLFFCAISRANIWVRTFIYNFVIESRTFFVTLDAALVSASQTMLLKIITI